MPYPGTFYGPVGDSPPVFEVVMENPSDVLPAKTGLTAAGVDLVSEEACYAGHFGVRMTESRLWAEVCGIVFGEVIGPEGGQS